MPHTAMSTNNVAVITGGASGIGLAAAMRFAGLGMKVCIADLGTNRLGEAETSIASVAPRGAADVMAMTADVSRIEDVSVLEQAVRERFGGTDILMNNAGIQPGSQMFNPLQNWQRILGVNLWGVIHGSQVFAPRMIAHGEPGLIINTGSKQGITTPPGDPAYNVSKAGVKAFTEALQHELRNTQGCRLSAHLLVPGFVFTPLTAPGRTAKPAGARKADSFQGFQNGASSESCPSASATGPMHDAQCGLVLLSQLPGRSTDCRRAHRAGLRSPSIFLARLRDAVPVTDFQVGMTKAPFI